MTTRLDTWEDPSPHTSHFVTVNGVRLHYLDWGGSGEPLVLIHGLGDTPHYFDDLARAFRDRWRVVAYARRGHGRSEARSPYDADTLAEDLRQLLDRLGLDTVNLAGWSLGGRELTRSEIEIEILNARGPQSPSAFDARACGPAHLDLRV